MMQDSAQAMAPAAVTAGFGERLVAYLIDAVIIFVVNMVLRLLLGDLGLLLSIFVGIVYIIGFWTAMGATPGKTIMKLQVVQQKDGQIPSVGTAILRYLGYFVSAIPLFLGFLWIIWDERKEGWHDKIAKTRVVKTQ